MAQPPHGPLPPDELIDETGDESFPASDAPGWSSMHVGAPMPRPLVAEHGHELRALLRADLERLARAVAGAAAAGGGPPASLEDAVARSILDAGRAVVREPVDESLSAWNVEAEQLGADREAPCVVIGARCLDGGASGAAMLLAILRALAAARTRRTVRFVVFANEPRSSSRFVARLEAERRSVHAMISLSRLGLARAGRGSRLLFVANLRSGSVARAARDAFRSSSRIPVRALVLPSWLPGVASSDHAAFWRRAWPAVMATDTPPWRAGRTAPGTPDVDLMAAAVPGLVAAVARLAGGRI